MKTYKVKLNYAGSIIITVEHEAESVGKAIDEATKMVNIHIDRLVHVKVKDVDL